LNIAVIGPNGAGKSTLITEILKSNSLVLPFSFSNYPRNFCKEKLSQRMTSMHDQNINKRVKDLREKWGAGYARSIFDPNRMFILDEIFLTKLLSCAPTSLALSEKFYEDFKAHLFKIMSTEIAYVDAYIYIKPSLEKWLVNASRRPVKATIHDIDQVRFQTQLRCFDYYISMLVDVPHFTVNDLEQGTIKDIHRFILRVSG